MLSTATGTEPAYYGLFPRAGEFNRLFRANADGRYTENNRWVFRYHIDAKIATRDETNNLLRGGEYAAYMFDHLPVAIEPHDEFAFYSLNFIVGQDDLLTESWTMDRAAGNHIHLALNYQKLLDTGIYGLLEEIDHHLDAIGSNPVEQDQRRRDFYLASKMTLMGLLRYVQRFHDEAVRLRDTEQNPTRWAELDRICTTLEKVPAHPADTLYEAIQSLFIVHFVIQLIEPRSSSVGRLDFILDKYYQQDLLLGRVTPQEMAEWLQIAFIRICIMSGQGDSIQVAGCDLAGNPFWNDISYFTLDAMGVLKLRCPQIWFRYTRGLPRSLVRRAFLPLGKGASQPGFFNDEVAIPALVRAGFTEEHARDYVSCQCVEISSAGRSAVLSGNAYYNLAKPIEILLNHGEVMIAPQALWPFEHFPSDIDTNYQSFADFQLGYEQYVREVVRGIVGHSNWQLANRPPILITLSSALIDGCIEDGVAALEGGALYDQTFPNFTSLITAADSLAAIRQCVYEEQKCTIDELAEMCRSNFEQSEDMRQYLLNRCPKYGNNDPRVDSLAKWIYDLVEDELSQHHNIYGETFGSQYFALGAPEKQAYELAATPDGRKFGEAPAGTLGADQGRDRKGLTALLNSVTSFDHTRTPGGLNVNVRIDPIVFNREEDLDKIIDIFTTYFHNGGMEVQINCISKEILLDAQQHPEQYRDLCVRVAGQSLYFCELGPALQKQIINRVQHTV